MLIEILQPTRTKKNASAQKKKKKEHGDDETSIHTLTHTHKHTRIQNPNNYQNLGSMDQNRSDRTRTYEHFRPGGPWNHQNFIIKIRDPRTKTDRSRTRTKKLE